MIIKSMSRKNASFEQLIDYMEKEEGERILYHNFYGHDKMSTAEISGEFTRNSQYLSKRKNGNYLYHEILSIENTAQLKEAEIKDFFHDIAHLYLQERAKNQMAFCVMHKDTTNPHMHFCISANNIGERKRQRLTKAQFSTIQKNLENYAIEKYPQLQQKRRYTKNRDKEQLKTSSREQALKKRTKTPSKKEQLKTKLHGIFEQAKNRDSLLQLLSNEGFELYTRGKTVGIIDRNNKNRKHRLKTLGILPHYEATNNRLDALATEKQNTTQQTREIRREEEKIQKRSDEKTIQQPTQKTEDKVMNRKKKDDMKQKNRGEKEVSGIIRFGLDTMQSKTDLALFLKKNSLEVFYIDGLNNAGVYDHVGKQVYNFSTLNMLDDYKTFMRDKQEVNIDKPIKGQTHTIDHGQTTYTPRRQQTTPKQDRAEKKPYTPRKKTDTPKPEKETQKPYHTHKDQENKPSYTPKPERKKQKRIEIPKQPTPTKSKKKQRLDDLDRVSKLHQKDKDKDR